MKRMTKAAVRTAVNLLFFTIIGTAILAFTFMLTHQAIEDTENAAKLKLINQVAPPLQYDNNLLQDTITLPASPLLGSNEPTIGHRGRLAGQPSLIVLSVVAPDGYSGKINLLVAITAEGKISGVRAVSHKETPGLGDYIEIAKSKWITIFDGAAHQQDADWKVKKDGGKFDYMAGATVTPRAVIKAVHKALQYFEANRTILLGEPASPVNQVMPNQKARNQ